MDPRIEHRLLATRRHLLGSMAGGIGGVALADLLGSPTPATAAPAASLSDPMAARLPPLPAKAKRMIVIHLTGSPPHLDLYDHKPELVKHSGEECPASTIEGKTFAFTSGTPKLLGTPRSWVKCGESGMELSDAIPNLHRVADRLCLIRSMHTDQFNHAPAELLVYTGSPRAGRPSLGSWVTYGLGSENANLPGFVVLISSGVQPNGGTASFGSGFLPSVYQGVQCRSKGDPVLYVSDPSGMSRQMRRTSLDALRDLNQMQAEALGDPETLTRIAQYELAFRMQASVPDLVDLSGESAETLALYGDDVNKPGSFTHSLILARRLVERGVRAVQILHRGWDQHGNLPNDLTAQCRDTDQATAALVTDLKRRGLLDDTLVVWGGEFGRTVYSQGTLTKDNYGRYHHPRNFCMWMAGGGVKGGTILGETDDFSYNVVENPVHIHDLNATMLHCLGVNHERLTFKYQGRHFRLTDVHGRVIDEILA